MRIVMHIDFDSFYASVEEQRNPSLAGKPLVICMFSGRSSTSGAVATANYPAREKGISAGMPIAFARKKIPDAAFLPADLEHYRAVSARIMDFLERYADSFEQRSIDEAYLDVSRRCASFADAAILGKEMKKAVFDSFRITCSVGIGPNKLVAKMASRFRKPDGLSVIEEGAVMDAIVPLPVRKLPGIGPTTESALAALGVKTIGQLANTNEAELARVCGSRKAAFLMAAAQGKDDAPVRGEERKQVSRIMTLREDTASSTALHEVAETLAGLVHEKLRGQQFRTVSIIVITSRLAMVTRSKTIQGNEQRRDVIAATAKELIDSFLKEQPAPVRRLGVRVAGLSSGNQQSLSRFARAG